MSIGTTWQDRLGDCEMEPRDARDASETLRTDAVEILRFASITIDAIFSDTRGRVARLPGTPTESREPECLDDTEHFLLAMSKLDLQGESSSSELPIFFKGRSVKLSGSLLTLSTNSCACCFGSKLPSLWSNSATMSWNVFASSTHSRVSATAASIPRCFQRVQRDPSEIHVPSFKCIRPVTMDTYTLSAAKEVHLGVCGDFSMVEDNIPV